MAGRRYKVNGTYYNIPEEKTDAFEKRYPDAEVFYSNGNDQYGIPLSKRQAFEKTFPNAVYYTSEKGNDHIYEAGDVEGNREQVVPSPYVGKDDSGRITVFGVPYDEYQNMPKEEQSKVYSKAIKDRKDQELKGFTAHASDLKASVNSELKEVMDLHNAEEKSYAKEHPVLSFLQGFGQAQTGGRNQRTIEANPRYRNLMAAANLLKDSENRLAEASADKSSSISNFGRGVRDKALDVDTWTAGFSKLADNTALLSALDKANKQEQLTSDEEKLLDALVTNLTVNAYTQSDISRGYQIGETTAYSLPFMLEFIANPIASSGNVIAKKLLTYGLKKFGKAATSKAAKVAGRLTGDIVAATGMTATTSLPRVAADTAGRLADNYTYDVDDNGELVVNKTGNTSFVGAAAKSAASRLIENQSEMIFNAFRGTGGMLWGTINKVMPGGVSSFFRKAANLKPVEWFRELANNETMREVAKRAQFHGIGEEYLEEVYNNFANIPLGEMTFEEAINLDNNITTFLSLAPTQIGFSLLGLGSMAVNRYSNRKKMRALFEKMTPEQQAKLTELTQMSKERGNEDIKKFIEITIADKNLTTEQKKDEIEYAFELAKQNAIEDLQQEQTPEGRAADDAYVQGTELPMEQRYSAEQERVVAEEALREVDENALNTIDRMLADDASVNEVEEIISGMDEESAKLARDYYNKSMRINGIVDSARDDAEEAVASFEASLQEAIIPDAEGNGTITTATLMSGAGEVKEEVYVIANDGVQATILQKDGTQKMVNLGLLDNVQTSLANDVVQLYQDQIGEQMRDQTDMSLNHHPKTRVPQPGMQIWNGDTSLIITEVNADGSVRAFPAVLNNKTGLMEPKNGSTPVDMSVKESLDLQDDYYNKMDAASIGINVSEKEGENAIGSRDEESKVSEDGTDYTLSDKTSDNGEPFYQDNSGNIDLAVIPQEVFDAIGKKAAPFRIIPSMLKHVFDRHGREMSLEEPQDAILFVLDVMDNFDHVRKGDKGALIFSIENGRSRTGKRAVTVLIDSKNGDYYGIKTSGYERIDGLQKRALLWEKGANETSTTGVAPANVTTAKAQQGNRQSGSASNQSNALSENKDTQKSSENQEVNVNNSIQFDEKGNPLYHKVPVDVTLADLMDGTLTDEEVDAFIAANQKEADSELKKITDKAPKIGTNKAKYLADKQAWQEKVSEAQAKVDYWNQVQDAIKENRNLIEKETNVNALNNEGNELSSQSDTNLNQENDESREVESLSREGNEVRREDAAESLLRSAGDRTTAGNGRSGWTKESVLGDVLQRSKENQTWIEDLESIAGKQIGQGGENEAYLSHDGKSVIKVNDFSYLPDNSTNLDDFVNRLDAHNELFPSDAITVLGFTQNSDGKISVVLSQPYISNAREATQEEIDSFLEGMDFYTDMSGNWTDGTFDIADTKPNNVLVDEEGILHFIDTLPYDSRKPGNMLVVPTVISEGTITPIEEAQIESQGKTTAEPVSPLENGGKTEVKLPQSKSNAKNKKRAADIKQARYELMDAKRELSVAQATNSGYTPEEVEEKKKRVEEAESKLKDLTNKVPDKEVSQNTDRIGKKGEQNLIHQDLIKSIYVKSLADMNESLKNIKENIKNEQEKEEPNSDLLEKLNIDKSALDRKIKRTKSVINKKVSIMSEGEFMLMNIINKNPSLPFSQMSENDVLNSVDENEINDILDKYPDYIKELSDNGALQKEFNEASIQDEINIRNAIESSGYEVEDLLDTSEKKKSQKKKGEEERIRKSEELMKKLGIYDESVRFRIVHHGTGASFDKFTTEKIGTGEGNAAFGWGLYFTEKKDIAQYYAETIGNMPSYVLYKDGKPADMNDEISRIIYNYDGDVKKAIRDNKRNAKMWEKEGDKDFASAIMETVSKLQKEDPKAWEMKEEGNRHIYDVEIPDTGFINWDKTVPEEQKKQIQDQAEKEGLSFSFYGDAVSPKEYFEKAGMELEGFQLYKSLTDALGSDKAASLFLNRAGFNGIEYEAGRHSANKKGNEMNFVVFDENAVRIIDHLRYRLISEQETANLDKVPKQREIIQTVEDLSDKLNTPIHIARSLDEIPDGSAKRAIEEGRKVKAWFDTGTREIFFYIPNATDVNDAKVSILHEVVGHKGLRNLFGTENETKFDSMMMDLFEKLPLNVRSEIADMAVSRYANNVSVAMDEYLAEQAEKDETPGWWDRIVSAIRDFFRKMGVDVKLSENDVKYLLWRSRKKLETGDLFEQAKDVVMRNKLGIGLNETQETSKSAPTESTRFREVEDEKNPLNKEMLSAWDNLAASTAFQLKETGVDYLTAVDKFTKLIADKTNSRVLDYENAYHALLALSSKNREEMNWYDSFVAKPLNDAIYNLVGGKKVRKRLNWDKDVLRDLVVYVESKHGIERNRQVAVENFINGYSFSSFKEIEQLGIPFDIDAYNKELKSIKDKVYKEAYDKAYDEYLNKYIDEGIEEKDASDKADKSAKNKADKAQSKASDSFRDKVKSDLTEKAREIMFNRWEEEKRNILNNTELTWLEKQTELDKAAALLGADLSKDYSGLSSVFKDSEDWKQAAYDNVLSYEGAHDKADLENLWSAVRNATNYALNKQLNTGLVSKEYVERQQKRFENYIPLRGFNDEIAGDVYSYLNNDVFAQGSPVKSMGGRTSEAGNPFGSILQIGYSSIAVGNKNIAKQRFYNFVSNHDTEGVAVVNNVWMIDYETLKSHPELKQISVKEEEEVPGMVEAVPDIPANATAEQISSILSSFEETMKELEKEGKAQTVKGKSKIAYRTLHGERSEHEIPLFIGGNRSVITITGNPRVAQAINGLTNPDSYGNVFEEFNKRMKRFMAGSFTSFNLPFAFANLSKDTMYANNQAFIRENRKWWWAFTKNQASYANPVNVAIMLMKYQKGTLDTNNKSERYFKEFMENGGATGYTFVETQKEYADKIGKILKELASGKKKLPEKLVKDYLFGSIEFLGQAAEVTNRYAAFRTSRELGRSISRSVNDAKDITVNFNRKGAGSKTKSPNNKTIVNLAAGLSEYGRRYILFWNAAMQSKYMLYKNLKEHPIKTSTTLIAGNIALGATIPFLNNMLLPALFEVFGWGSDDDKEDYYDVLTDYERQHNIMIRLPKGLGWFKFPLSPEFVPFYSVGDMITGSLSGKRKLDPLDIVKSAIDAASPLNIQWEYKDVYFFLNFLPTVIQPGAQIMTNVNFMGSPLKKTPINREAKNEPEFKNVFKNESPALIELSRLTNKLTGGDDVVRGAVSWNPAYVRNLITGYSGGWGGTFLSIADWMVGTANGEKQTVLASQTPFVSRFLSSGNKDVKLKRINSNYQDVVDFYSKIKHDERGYEKKIDETKDYFEQAEYQSKLNKLLDSEEYGRYQDLENIVETIKDLEKLLKDDPDDEQLRDELYASKLKAIEIYHREKE